MNDPERGQRAGRGGHFTPSPCFWMGHKYPLVKVTLTLCKNEKCKVQKNKKQTKKKKTFT